MTTAIGRRRVETYIGDYLDPLDPDPDAIWLRDIAHSLSQVCRFQGHTRRFYSVAEHSIYVAERLKVCQYPPVVVLAGLLHDASEAYLCDLVSPLKHDVFGEQYCAAERRLMRVIAERYGFESVLGHGAIDEADEILVWCEAHTLLNSEGTTWDGYEQRGRRIIEEHPEVRGWIEWAEECPFGPREIEERFIRTAYENRVKGVRGGHRQ